jgi:hypothetical protein
MLGTGSLLGPVLYSVRFSEKIFFRGREQDGEEIFPKQAIPYKKIPVAIFNDSREGI